MNEQNLVSEADRQSRTPIGVSPLAAIVGAMLAPMIAASMPAPKPNPKCLLPSCDVHTGHNGGYCCAEHCKEHRRLRAGRF